MIIRRWANHPSVRPGLEKRQPKRSRPGRYVAVTIGAGVICGMAALAGIWPFGSLQTYAAQIGKYVHAQPAAAPIDARAVFPAVPPVHKVIDVYDPAPPPAKQQPGPPVASPTPDEHKHKPSPSPGSSPRPSPSATPPDD